MHLHSLIEVFWLGSPSAWYGGVVTRVDDKTFTVRYHGSKQRTVHRLDGWEADTGLRLPPGNNAWQDILYFAKHAGEHTRES